MDQNVRAPERIARQRPRESEAIMQSASDVRDDYAALKGAITRLAELNKILS